MRFIFDPSPRAIEPYAILCSILSPNPCTIRPLMIIKSFAKINLSLKITGRREDGYHDLQMVNLPIELHDVIELDTTPISPATTCAL